jgi:hypothetical protein
VQGVLKCKSNQEEGVKAKQQETSTVAVAPATKQERSVFDAGEESFRSCQIIPRMNELLDQFKHHKPPSITTWSYCGPSEKLFSLLLERNSGAPDGLPDSADAMVAWLQVNANAKRVRAAQILISFPPHPRNGKEVMVRMERAETVDEYRSRTA